MKICFVNPPFKASYGKFSRENRSPAVTRSGVLYYPLWLIYAAALCEKDGFEIFFLDAPAAPLDETESLERITEKASDARLFVVGTSTPSVENDIAFTERLKELYPKAISVLVGTHVSALPEETLQKSNQIDAIACGEYDFTIRDLARTLERGESIAAVPGIIWRDGKTVRVNEKRPHAENLDEIPFAAEFIENHLNHRDYFFAAAAYPEIQIYTGRGCPAHCNFCVYPQVMHGHKYRLRSPENVVAEFQYIADHFPDVKEVVIEDDTFTADRGRVEKICELLIERGLHKRLRWLCNARVNLDLATMKKMKAAGCHLIIPGIESGSQQILNNIKKGTTLELIHDYVKNAKKAGLMVHACYMVGNKGETKETMEETLRLALKLNTDTAQFYALNPYPGTEAYEWAKSNGYLRGGYRDYCKEDGTLNCVLELPGISSAELVEFCDYARRKYYLRPQYIAHRLWVGLRNPEDLKRSIKAFLSIKKYLFQK